MGLCEREATLVYVRRGLFDLIGLAFNAGVTV